MLHSLNRILLISGVMLTLVFGASAQDDRLQVVASYSILGDVVANVAGDAADVAVTMPAGADPHSFQPTPSDLVALAEADIVFVNGGFFEEGLLEAIENAGDEMNIVTASECVQIIAFGGDHEHGDEDHEHGDEDHDDDEHGDEDHDDDEHGDEDHDDDEHGDEDHMSEGDMSAIAVRCEAHYAEMAALHDHGDHEHGDEDHDDDEHGDEDHDDDEHGDEDHEHGDEDHDEHGHDHGKVETLGALYAVDCGVGHSHDDDHGDEEEEHSDEDGHEGHDHGVCDVHVWMEPHNVMYWTMQIRDTLIDMDPANAETYTANASAYLEAVDTLTHDFVMPMVETVPEENRVLISNHDTLGYFAAAYDFEVVQTIIPGGSTLAEPSAADVAAVIELIREESVPAIFAETTVSDELAQQIASETDATVHVLYSGSLSEADGPASTYLDYMRYNVTTIVEALGGGM
jgi:ABC-type Zn uptake system ZnuABC Zn-binding protein ZnuA